MVKIKESTVFSGKKDEDVILWTQKMQTYIDSYDMSENEAIRCIFMSLDGVAAYWFQQERVRFNTATEALRALRDNYIDEAKIREAEHEFYHVKQTGSLSEYSLKIKKLAIILANIHSEETIMRQFINGLKPNNSKLILLMKPKTLNEAIKYAQEVDLMDQREKGWILPVKATQPTTARPTVVTSVPANDPMDIGAIRSRKYQSFKPKGQQKPFLKKDTYENKSFFTTTKWPTTKGAICHYCGKKNHTAAQCQKRRQDLAKKPFNNKRQYQYTSFDRSSMDLSTLHLNMLGNVEEPSKLFLTTGQVRGVTVTILIDSGAAHNFIREQVVTKHNFDFEDMPQKQIVFANGDRYNVRHCLTTRCKIGDFASPTTFVVAPIAYDIILKMKWLQDNNMLLDCTQDISMIS
ncbi:MAG: retropepsin-like aspartic protease family protein, partial [Opitutales bacterium]|nr:retropepsin-like aspartic protease family protein [Opitutales bacterium]